MQLSSDELEKLRREFSLIDLDGSGRINKDELDTFLAQKGIEDGHRQTIVDELFQKCDIDQSGKIELNEFVEHYLGTKVQLQMRERELRQAIVESN